MKKATPVCLVAIGELGSRAGLWVVVEAGLDIERISSPRFSFGMMGDDDLGKIGISCEYNFRYTTCSKSHPQARMY